MYIEGINQERVDQLRGMNFSQRAVAMPTQPSKQRTREQWALLVAPFSMHRLRAYASVVEGAFRSGQCCTVAHMIQAIDLVEPVTKQLLDSVGLMKVLQDAAKRDECAAVIRLLDELEQYGHFVWENGR